MDITLALDRYDRHFPFFDGSLDQVEGLKIEPFQVDQSANLRDGNDRHERFLKGEFDVAEFSMSSFLAAKSKGIPIVGVPVFPRRLFSQSQMWVRQDSGLVTPNDLAGKRVALSAFQTTLSLLAKGDLEFHYQVPWRSIKWKTTTAEKIPLNLEPGVDVEFIGGRDRLGTLLMEGEIDAFFLPHPPANVTSGEVPARRLFLNPVEAEAEYFQNQGFFPIMHLIVMHQELADRDPEMTLKLMALFHQASDIAENYYTDPNWSLLVGCRHHFENERKLFNGTPWLRGFKANRKNIEVMIRYAKDQSIVSGELESENLFSAIGLET